MPTASAAPHPLDEAKRAARHAALARRADLDPALAEAVAAHILALPLAHDRVIAGFWPLPGELDLRDLLHALHIRGHAILLPQTPLRGNQLIFRHWHPAAAMLRERFGTYRPDGPVGTPDLLLVPLLAYDRAGHRLGYGGGYYDRTLAALPDAHSIGCAWSAQELDSVPAGPYDARLHQIATEHGVITTESP